MENQITIEGIISLNPKAVVTPSGIPQRTWTMQHQSERYEVGIRRKVWLRIAVGVTGKELVSKTESLKAGDRVRCTGFITAIKGAKGDTPVALHAQKVEKVEAGEE